MRRPFSRLRSLVGLALAALAFLALLLYAPELLAQHSGGSFGGSHFGGGGGGFHGGGGFGGGGFGGGGYHGGGSGRNGGAGILLLFDLFIRHPLIFTAVTIAVLFALWMRNPVPLSLPGPEARAWMNIDVTAIRIVVDGSARAFIQGELAKVSRANTASRAGLLASLKRVTRLVRKCDSAWIYGGATNFRPMSAPVGEAAFRKLVNEARSKFQHELVRNADGKLREAKGPAYAAHSRDGDGVALVTIVVAAKREILDFDGGDRAQIAKVLRDLDRLTADTLVALEVSWSPADPNDRISTMALEAIYPDLKKLPGAIGGRVDCSHCRGPFAAELPTCPHCGAPSPRLEHGE